MKPEIIDQPRSPIQVEVGPEVRFVYAYARQGDVFVELCSVGIARPKDLPRSSGHLKTLTLDIEKGEADDRYVVIVSDHQLSEQERLELLDGTRGRPVSQPCTMITCIEVSESSPKAVSQSGSKPTNGQTSGSTDKAQSRTTAPAKSQSDEGRR